MNDGAASAIPPENRSFYPPPGEPGELESSGSEHALFSQAGSKSSPGSGSPNDLPHSLVQNASFANHAYESATFCACPLYGSPALRRARTSLAPYKLMTPTLSIVP